MPNYICFECGKLFNHRNDYTKHVNRKFTCKKDDMKLFSTNIYDNINIGENLQNSTGNGENLHNSINMCNYCLKIYSDKYILHRHMKSHCKVKKQEEQKKEKIYQQLLRENEELKKENEELKKSAKIINNSKKITNNIHNGDINNNNINNFVIIAHGREDLDKIDIKYILEALKRGTSCIPVITERIHFNEKYPEFQNVYITNMNQKYGMIYDGREWKLKDKDTIIEDLYEKKYDFLDENFETIYNQLSESQQKAFRRFLDIHEKADTDKQSKKIIDKIKRDLKFLLYNNKKIPIDTYSKYSINN